MDEKKIRELYAQTDIKDVFGNSNERIIKE